MWDILEYPFQYGDDSILKVGIRVGHGVLFKVPVWDIMEYFFQYGYDSILKAGTRVGHYEYPC